MEGLQQVQLIWPKSWSDGTGPGMHSTFRIPASRPGSQRCLWSLLWLAGTGVCFGASLSLEAQETDKSPISTADVPLPFAYNYGETDTTRSGGMSGALRAAGNGTTAIFVNPAGMTLTRVYHIEAIGQITPEFGRHVYGGMVVDSITNKLAGGVAVTGGFLDAFSDEATAVDRSWLDIRLALAYPIVEGLSVGLGGRYLKLTENGEGPLGTSKVSGGLKDPEGGGRLSMVNLPTFDAGLTFKAGDLVVLGVSGQNLTFPDDGVLPTTVGGGIAVAHTDFTIEADGVADLSSYASPAARIMAGGEYLLVDHIPIRAGYRFDSGAESHQISAGLGYIASEFMVEASVRRTLVGPDATEIIFGAGYFLESSGLTGRGDETSSSSSF